MEALAWCRQRMLAPGSPLAASLPFAPAEWRDAILALRAAVSEIAAVPDSVSDVEIGRRKLAWWREALRERQPHPAIEALAVSGALDRLGGDALDGLIGAVEDALEPPRFDGRSSAWRHCLELGGSAAMVESRLVDPDFRKQSHWAASLGAFGYLVRMVRDLPADARAGRWPVPLELQAEYQVARHDLVGGSPGSGWDGLVRAWLEDGLKRVGAAGAAAGADTLWRQRHLVVFHALDRRLVKAIARRPQRMLERRIVPGHAGNVWTAWRCARSLRRGKSGALSPS